MDRLSLYGLWRSVETFVFFAPGSELHVSASVSNHIPIKRGLKGSIGGIPNKNQREKLKKCEKIIPPSAKSAQNKAGETVNNLPPHQPKSCLINRATTP